MIIIFFTINFAINFFLVKEMRKRSARKRRAEAGPPLVPDPREEIGGEEVDVGTLGLGFVGAGFAGIREIGVGVRTAEGESAIEHRRRVGP